MTVLPKLAIVVALSAGTAAFAQGTTRTEGTRIGPNTDPHRIVCIKDTELGSRLRFRRVCRTVAEWRTHRQEARLELDTILHPTN